MCSQIDEGLLPRGGVTELLQVKINEAKPMSAGLGVAAW